MRFSRHPTHGAALEATHPKTGCGTQAAHNPRDPHASRGPDAPNNPRCSIPKHRAWKTANQQDTTPKGVATLTPFLLSPDGYALDHSGTPMASNRHAHEQSSERSGQRGQHRPLASDESRGPHSVAPRRDPPQPSPPVDTTGSKGR